MLSLLLYAVGMAAQQPDWGYNPNAYPDEHVIYVGLVDDQGSAVQSFNDNTTSEHSSKVNAADLRR